MAYVRDTCRKRETNHAKSLQESQPAVWILMDDVGVKNNGIFIAI